MKQQLNENAENPKVAAETKDGAADVAVLTDVNSKESGSAIVIALLIMALLMVFVAIAISRTTSETLVMANDSSEGRAYAAAQASLEITTRNFNKIFDNALNPTQADLDRIQGQTPPGMDNFSFDTIVQQIEGNRQTLITGGLMQGLYATRSRWRVDSTATERATGVQVQLRREFFNNLVPIFQFGIFYDHDLEFHPGPRFDFGGRVHSNGDLYLMAGTGLYFSSRVSSARNIITQLGRSGVQRWNDNVFVKDASGNFVQLRRDMGSALNNTVNGPNLCTRSFPNDAPPCYQNSSWDSVIAPQFGGNLLANQSSLNLPIRTNSGTSDYIQFIKRGKENGSLCGIHNNTTPVPCGTSGTELDTPLTARQRYANKNGIRISLADSKAKLPGCASGVGTNPVSTPCGIRLDGAASGNGADAADVARGYDPMTYPMGGGYKTTRLNGNRFNFNYNTSGAGTGSAGGGGRIWSNRSQVWIKVELISFDPNTGAFQNSDVTADFLSLGVTETPRRPNNVAISSTNFQLVNKANDDTRSVIELQRWIAAGDDIRANSGIAGSSFMFPVDWGTDGKYNLVNVRTGITSNNCATGTTPAAPYNNPTIIANENLGGGNGNLYPAIANIGGTTTNICVAPFPIKLFDHREGLYNATSSVLNIGATYPNGAATLSGTLSIVQINVANLRTFLNGAYDNLMPTNTPFALAKGRGLRSSDIPLTNGYIVYVSDRRGDQDFDGEYDMEDIYPNSALENGEDVNRNGVLDIGGLTTGEAPPYSLYDTPDSLAAIDHKYYRRGVRLVNGMVLPGIYDALNPSNTKGFTVASENAVYVQGNYNATGVASYGTPTPSTDYLPQNTPVHIPASVAADAIYILSNNWKDANSFRYPFSKSGRIATETTARFAIIAGDSMSSLDGTPNQGGTDTRMCGGVHNFKRFIEDWSNTRLNYTGSLINLFNARNNNGSYKNGGTDPYSPPIRNWAFDTTFLDPARLPPGTPFIQYLQLTGFQRVNQ
jgi:hypothetical protein